MATTKILIPTPLRPYTDKQEAVEAHGATIGELLADATKTLLIEARESNNSTEKQEENREFGIHDLTPSARHAHGGPLRIAKTTPMVKTVQTFPDLRHL